MPTTAREPMCAHVGVATVSPARSLVKYAEAVLACPVINYRLLHPSPCRQMEA